MATEQPLTPTVLDQNEDAMPDEDVTYTSDDEGVATVTSDGLVEPVAEGETFIRVASVTDPDVFFDVPVTVAVGTPGASPAVLTSAPNGFRRGLNFSDVGITNGTTIRAAIIATFGGIAPVAGNWSLVDDATYGKVARLTLPPADFALYLNGLTSVLSNNARIRLLMKFNGFDPADLNTRPTLRLVNYDHSPTIYVSVEPESNGDMSLKPINSGVASLTTVTSSGTTLRNSIADGAWKELILEHKDNGNSTYTEAFVAVNPGSARTPALTRTSTSGDYLGADGLQFDAFEVLGPYTESDAATIDFALIESCDPFDGDDVLIALSRLGDGAP